MISEPWMSVGEDPFAAEQSVTSALLALGRPLPRGR